MEPSEESGNQDPAATAAGGLAAALWAVGERQDRTAFARLFAFYAPRAKAYYRELGADDARAEGLAEEAMLAIWRDAGRFARDPSGADAGGWIFARVRDTGVVGLQGGRPRPDFDADDPALVEDTYNPVRDPGTGAPSAPRAPELVAAALERLPIEEVKLLRTLYQAPLAGTPRAVDAVPPEAGARLRLALARLRGLLGGGSR